MHGAKVHLVAGRYHCHEVTLVVFQHDALGQSITGNVSGLRSVVVVVVVVNAHDRYSAYNTMAGVRSPMAQHGRIPRDPREPRTRNTAPW